MSPPAITDENGQPVFCQECGAVLIEDHERDRNYHYRGCRMPPRVQEMTP